MIVEFEQEYLSELYKTGEKVSMKDLIAQAKEIKNDGYTEASWNKLQSEIAAAEDLM